MSQRLLSVSLVLNALLLGLLLRPSGPVSVAEAQNQTAITCLGFVPGEGRKAIIRLHNGGTTDLSAQVRWLDQAGGSIQIFNEVIAAGATLEGERTEDNIGVVVKINSPSSSLVVDAEMVYDNRAEEFHRRTVSCIK